MRYFQIFQFSDISGEDVSKWDKLKTIELDGRTGIELPCSYLDNCNCSTYNDKPKICSSYSCKVLRRYDQGVLKFDDAKTIIEKTKSLMAEFEGEFNEHFVYNKGIPLAKNIQKMVEVVGGQEEFKTFATDHEDFGMALRDLLKVIKNQFRAQKKNEGKSKPK